MLAHEAGLLTPLITNIVQLMSWMLLRALLLHCSWLGWLVGNTKAGDPHMSQCTALSRGAWRSMACGALMELLQLRPREYMQ